MVSHKVTLALSAAIARIAERVAVHALISRRRNASTAINRLASIVFTAFAVALLAMPPASAAELVYGSWTPAREYQNAMVMPKIFSGIEKETQGAIKWKLIPGGQLADGKATFTAVRDGLMEAGLAIAVYVPNMVPSLHTLYSTLIFGDDVVAASGAAMEAFTLNCPSCLEEFRKLNSVPIAGWDSAPYQLMCREPVKSVAEIKGKRIRATGGGAEMFRMVGGVPVAGTLSEAVSLLQRGGLDCIFGAAEWLKTFGYGDFVKYVADYPLGMSGPAIGIMLNRDAWKGFTLEQKKIHLKYAARMSAEMAIGAFIMSNENSLKEVIAQKGVSLVKVGTDFDGLVANYRKAERDRNIAVARGFGVQNPAAIIDAYERALVKWKGLSKGIGRDIDKFTEALWREIYSKVDPDKL